MRPVKFPNSNITLGPPKGDNGTTQSMPAYQGVLNFGEHKTNGFVSCWELEELDIAELLRTKKIYLFVVGEGHPPVLMTTVNPFHPIHHENGNTHDGLPAQG